MASEINLDAIRPNMTNGTFGDANDETKKTHFYPARRKLEIL